MTGLERIVRRVWVDRHGLDSPPWLTRVTPSQVCRSILRDVVRGLDPTAATAPDAATVAAVLDRGGWAVVRELAELADTFAAEAAAHFEGLPARRRPETATRKNIGERACTTVAALYRGAGDRERAAFAAWAAPELARRRERYQATEAERHGWTEVLHDDETFVARFTPHLDQQWERRERDPGLAELPLGELGRPPMRAARDATEDWTCGTDRSVLSRYRHYRSARGLDTRDAVAEAAGIAPDRHMSVRLRAADPDRLARSEVERACAPVGLSSPGHRALLRSVADGVATAALEERGRTRTVTDENPLRPAGRRTSSWPALLGRWGDAAPELPAGPDAELVLAVVERAEFWAARQAVSYDLVHIGGRRETSLDDPDLVLDADATQTDPTASAALGTGGDGLARPAPGSAAVAGPWSWVVQVRMGVLRRLWFELLRREIEWDTPFVRAEVRDLLPAMFGRHLYELVRRPLAPADRTGPPAPDAREQATLAALERAGVDTVRDLLVAVATGRPGWPERYAELLGDTPAGHALEAAELPAFLAAHLSAAPRRADDPGPGEPADDADEVADRC